MWIDLIAVFPMRLRTAFLLTITWLAMFWPTDIAHSETEWGFVAAGIDFQQFVLPGPNRAFVARMDRSSPNVIVDSTVAQGKLYEGTETVSGMAQRYDQSIVGWGSRWDATGKVAVAINGIFYDPSTGIPQSGQIQGGWYIKRFGDYTGGIEFAFNRDREAFIGGCAMHPDDEQWVYFLDRGRKMELGGINVPQNGDNIVIFTPQYDFNTHSGNDGVEVLVEMLQPAGIGSRAKGYIRSIRDVGSTRIPFDHLVISGRGLAGKRLAEHARIGERVGILSSIDYTSRDCRDRHPWSWDSAFSSIGGSFNFLHDGDIVDYNHDAGATTRHPRTAVCLNDEYIFFVVVDGRQPGYSIGMTSDELGRFCRDRLDANWGINQDGGGSSAMWLDGEIVNLPSDGQERPVANGLTMVVLEPVHKSTKFEVGEPVRTLRAADIRVGPGDNYAAYTTIPEGDPGIVLSHINGLNGVYARGTNWWRVAFERKWGWIAEDDLEAEQAWIGLWKGVHDKVLRSSNDSSSEDQPADTTP
ncbi:MAG: phosphodiester glycosidase family protein [Anaerolineales bacterium]